MMSKNVLFAQQQFAQQLRIYIYLNTRQLTQHRALAFGM
jgi:hypothetical protein